MVRGRSSSLRSLSRKFLKLGKINISPMTLSSAVTHRELCGTQPLSQGNINYSRWLGTFAFEMGTIALSMLSRTPGPHEHRPPARHRSDQQAYKWDSHSLHVNQKSGIFSFSQPEAFPLKLRPGNEVSQWASSSHVFQPLSVPGGPHRNALAESWLSMLKANLLTLTINKQ